MINILYCGNWKVFDGLLTSALSIVMRSSDKEPLNITVFTMSLTRLKEDYTPITDKQIAFINKVLKKYNPENRVTKVDVSDLYEKYFAYCPNEGCYCSPYTLLRLFADLAIEGDEKLLYLDADIMFNRDINLLYSKDVEGYEYAAARDHYGKFVLNPNYINAGVVLFNMKEARKTGLFEKARNLIMTKKMLFADQDAIYRSTTKKKMLPHQFNDQKFLLKKTVVRHFSKRLFYLPYPHTEIIKQWQIDKMKKKFRYTKFDDILVEYENLKADFEENN